MVFTERESIFFCSSTTTKKDTLSLGEYHDEGSIPVGVEVGVEVGLGVRVRVGVGVGVGVGEYVA